MPRAPRPSRGKRVVPISRQGGLSLCSLGSVAHLSLGDPRVQILCSPLLLSLWTNTTEQVLPQQAFNLAVLGQSVFGGGPS